jgi:sulfate adenylyltransferase large subunit
MAPISEEQISVAPRSSGNPATAEPALFDVETYLEHERAKDLLRFSTAGSVDDGKSTLIGRLLYDTQNVYEDQVASIEGKGSAGVGRLDLALLTDGLRAEREQGITIDVAYRYFATSRRKFIIADTPGHEQYTRNMATGASTADAAIILVDARKGVLLQSRRHAYIAALLGVPHLVVAINKMDLVGYAQQSYERIREEFSVFFAGLEEHGASMLHFVPVSALAGDNVARGSDRMPWYGGLTLLALLETLPSTETLADKPFRFAVQRVLRPNQHFRGFAGQIAAGTVRAGDTLQVLPSQRLASVRSIVTFDGEMAEAMAPLSVCLTLEGETDISRGDMLVSAAEPANTARAFTASLVWMDAEPLVSGRRYLLKHTSRTVRATVRRLLYSVDVADLRRSDALTLAMNGIGEVEIETAQPLTLDPYASNRHTGSFVLIDAVTNATVAAGMVRAVLADADQQLADGPVGVEERVRRWGHQAAHLVVTGSAEFADALERALFERGAVAFRCGPRDGPVQQSILDGGGIVLTLVPAAAGGWTETREGKYVTVAVAEEPGSGKQLDQVSRLLALLEKSGILRGAHTAHKGLS